ncbi:hypothetical protein SAMN05216268_13119 [Streptomyces yunnanensis]|uniref:Uncharacterized protein n=1 Tax=Streptomyces yunnanensis TaxID=156453 RepID=A0A9X8R017_9ACTN|nr:hypothetical protein SAMN05216268_13119 [Streptomyces yunnanensis]
MALEALGVMLVESAVGVGSVRLWIREAAAAMRAMTMARVKTTTRPSWKGLEIRSGKNSRPVRIALLARDRWPRMAGPRSYRTGL